MIVSTISALGQECKKLDDGQYFFKYKSPKKYVMLLTIKGDSYSLSQDGQKNSKGKIEWWDYNCMFKLVSDETEVEEKLELLLVPPKTDSIKVLLPNTDAVTVLRNTFLFWGSHCYELIGRRNLELLILETFISRQVKVVLGRNNSGHNGQSPSRQQSNSLRHQFQ